MFDYNALGAGIRATRKRMAISADDLSAKLNIGRKYLLKVENGSVKPSTTLILHICNILNVGIGDLLEGCSDSLFYRQFKSEIRPLSQEERRFFTNIIVKVSSTEGEV